MKLEFTEAEVNERVAPFAAVLAQEEFHKEVDRLCVSERRWGTRREMRARALKWHGDRCTFEIAVRTESGWHHVIGKVYKTDRSDVFQAMEVLRRAGFSEDAEFSIPQPLVYLSSLGVRLEEKVRGPSAKDLFLNGGPHEHIAAAERCGRWLARFHAVSPRLGNVADLGAEFVRYRYWTDRVTDFGEPLASKSERLFEELNTAAPTLAAIEGCGGHGSYIPEHVILSGSRTAAIDLDEYDVGDPSRDVAWFVVSLQRLALRYLGSLHALDSAAQQFLSMYVASGREDAIVNFPFYRALECLHGAKRDIVGQTPPAPDRAEIMLDEGLRALC